jgi:signal transduction histidine kinase
MRQPQVWALVSAGAVAAGVAVEWAADPAAGFAVAATDLTAGCALFVCGGVALCRRPRSPVGPIMGIAGLTWFLGTASEQLAFVHRGPLVQLYATFPTGRSRSRLLLAVVAAAYVDGSIERVARNGTLTVLLAAAVAVVTLRGFSQTSGTERPPATTALGTTLAYAAALVLGALDSRRPVLWTYDLVIAASTVVLLIDLVRDRRRELLVTGLVVDLGGAAETGTLRARLAQAVGDPSLVVGYRVAQTDAFVDDAGLPVALPAADSGRTVTPLVDRGEQIAVLVHEAGLATDTALVASVAAAARIALANAAMQAEARTKEEELAASRRRIVEAGDATRRRIGEELRRGAGESLARVAALLEQARPGLEAADAAALSRLDRELDDARAELEELARGILPMALTEGGLEPALAQLAARAAVPVEVRGGIERLPSSIEAALYFVCSEALANVGKHARASKALIELVEHDGRVRATISDDGAGGADVAAGSGLRGLADRVEALGGRLQVTSPAGRGTRIVAEIPISSRA